MPIELACLVVQALWGFVLVSIEIVGKTSIAGPAWNRGNREETREFPPWIHRTSRALGNHKENFPLFLTAVVAVLLTQEADRLSAIGSVVYVVARFAHAGTYIGGITGLRSAVFLTGLAATGAVYLSLLVG